MSGTDPCFRELDHTADLAIEVWGEDFAGLLANAASAVLTLEGLPLEAGEPVHRELRVTAFDREALLVDWLNEVLYLSEMYGELYTSFEIALESGAAEMSAVVYGYRGRPTKRWIKAATFHDLRITDTPGRCAARIVFDV